MSYNVKKERQNSEAGQKEFRTFEDLEVYQEAREFRKKMYGVPRTLPDFEKFDLASQIRRPGSESAVREVAVTSNNDKEAWVLLNEALNYAVPF